MLEDELNCKRQHFTEKLISGSNADTITKMRLAKHSTFDLSKFTVVGSPNITDDGIASGFSKSNYLEINPLILTGAQKVSVKCKFKTPYSIPNKVLAIWGAKEAFYAKFYIYSNSKIQMDYGNGINWTNEDIQIASYQTNTEYTVETIVESNKISFKLDGELVKEQSIITPFNVEQIIHYIGSARGVSSFENGSIDLKQFSITVDEVEVFSGNKTGIDIIKPDNFIIKPDINSSIVINEEGLASGFDRQSYIITDYLSSEKLSDFEIDLNVIVTGVTSYENNRVFGQVSGSNMSSPQIEVGPNSILFAVSENMSSWVVCSWPVEVVIGREYRLRCVVKDKTSFLYVNDDLKDFKTLTDSVYWTDRGGIGTDQGVPFAGSVDLNSFKIYVNGSLVYQPLLRIPYTITSEGKKITSNNRLSRIEDQYVQAGYTPYYSLMEEDQVNLAIIGSPIIDSSYMASSFSSSNYLNLPNSFGFKGDWEIVFKLRTPQTLRGGIDTYCFGYLGGNRNITFGLTGVGTFTCYYSSNGSSWDIVSNAMSQPVTLDSIYTIKLSYLNGVYYAMCKLEEEGTWETWLSKPSNLKIYSSGNLFLGVSYSDTRYWDGSIDLSSFKIYSDEKLVYEAVTYPQYTMATIKPSELVDSKINGANIYRQYANQTIEQYGTCTSGTAVTFEKPFMDTNYALSVPYSAKTKTGFTPTQTGSWKAKGKVSI